MSILLIFCYRFVSFRVNLLYRICNIHLNSHQALESNSFFSFFTVLLSWKTSVADVYVIAFLQKVVTHPLFPKQTICHFSSQFKSERDRQNFPFAWLGLLLAYQLSFSQNAGLNNLEIVLPMVLLASCGALISVGCGGDYGSIKCRLGLNYAIIRCSISKLFCVQLLIVTATNYSQAF